MTVRTLFLALMATAFLGGACDVIPLDEVNEVVPLDTTQQDSNTLAVDFTQRVLLEDFTGHTCPNCPKAAKEAKDLLDFYGDNLVVMAWHVGFFAEPQPWNDRFRKDLRTSTGEKLNIDYGIDRAGLPKGMINRKEHDQTLLLGFTSWRSYVPPEMALQSNLDIEFKEVSYQGGNLTLNLAVHAKDTINKKIWLDLYLTEDSIVGWQIDKVNNRSVEIDNYLQMHVVRAKLDSNLTDRSLLNTTVLAPGSPVERKYTIPIKDAWRIRDMKNCHLVATLREEKQFPILQCRQSDIKLP